MNLQQYLRLELSQKFIPLVKKDKCKICNSVEELEVHHETQFIHIIEEVLKFLNIEYKDLDEYTEEELELIKLVVFGKHLEIKYITLCKECHIEIHKEFGRDKGNITEIKKQKRHEKELVTLVKYIKKLINKKLYKKDKNNFQKFLYTLNSLIKGSHKSIGLKSINKMFNDNGLNYIINSYRDRKSNEYRDQTYWIISEL